eukprot:5522065-Pleurochrysis_carterae.AAC.2
MAGARRLCFGADFAAVFRADCAVFLARIVSRALPRACRTPKTADFGLCSRPQRHQRRAVEAAAIAHAHTHGSRTHMSKGLQTEEAQSQSLARKRACTHRRIRRCAAVA